MANTRLAGLMEVAKRQREARTLNRCHTCRNKQVRDATAKAIADIAKYPDRYGGLTQLALWEWSGAKAAGIMFEAYRKHFEVHVPGALEALARAR